MRKPRQARGTRRARFSPGSPSLWHNAAFVKRRPSWSAESFVTDNGFRNRAIHRFILEANNFPAITFVCTALEGLPSPASVGQTYAFRLTGDLTIRDTTRSVTFEVTLTVESADLLSGSATATIEGSEFGLSIPSVPQVAEVSTEVILEIDFTAVRTG